MPLNLTNLFSSRQWFDMNVPEWYMARVEALGQTLGEDHQDLTVFKEILSAGQLTEELIQNTHTLASSTQHRDIFLLAVDIANHACTTMQTIALIVPVNKQSNV